MGVFRGLQLTAALWVVLWSIPGVLPAQVTTVLRGQVVDSATDLAIAGAVVDTRGTTVTTDVAGRFTVRGLEPGRHELRVTAIGYRPVTLPLSLSNGVVKQVRILLVAAPLALDELVVRGRTRTLVPGGRILDRATVDSSSARDLGELLRNEPGLMVIRTGGAGSASTVSIRGSNPDQVLVLLDGTPINDPTSGVADLSSIALGAVERVIVIPGAAAARYGPGALAGVIAVESRRPTATERRARVEAGSFGELGAAATVTGGGTAGEWALSGLAAGELRRTTGDFRYAVPVERGGGRAHRQNADARTASLFATGTLGRGVTTLRARVEWFDADRGMPGPVTQPSLTGRQDQNRLGGVIGAATDLGGWKLDAEATSRRQRARYRDPSPPSRPPFDDSTTVTERVARARATGSLAGLAAAAGGEYRRQEYRATSLDVDAPRAASYGGGWATLRLHTAPAAGHTVELFGALRADAGSRIGGAELSPMLGAEWRFGRLAVGARWGQAFSPPTLSDQFFQEGVSVKPNPDLGPERVRNEWVLSLGISALRLGPLDLSADLAGYRSNIDGMILWLPDFRFVWSPRNFDVDRRGLDIGLQTTLRPSGATLHAGYNLTEVEYAGPVLAGQVAYRPRHSATLGLDVPYGRWRGGIEARHTGERRTVPGSALNTLPGYWLVDLQASVVVSLGEWSGEAFLRVENLLDEDASLLGDYPLPSRALRAGWRLER